MATYVLIHGAGDVGWYWHLVERELRARGHHVAVMDLIVVAQSYGGYVAPIVCDRVPAGLLVLVAPMIPAPGESAQQMLANTRFDDAERPRIDDWDSRAIFYHDVPRPLAEEALSKGRDQSDTTGAEPFPLAAWPDVPTAVILCLQDRMFPAAWLRQVVRDRLDIEPDEIDSGHTPALSHPVELTNLLEHIRVEKLDVDGG